MQIKMLGLNEGERKFLESSKITTLTSDKLFEKFVEMLVIPNAMLQTLFRKCARIIDYNLSTSPFDFTLEWKTMLNGDSSEIMAWILFFRNKDIFNLFISLVIQPKFINIAAIQENRTGAGNSGELFKEYMREIKFLSDFIR